MILAVWILSRMVWSSIYRDFFPVKFYELNEQENGTHFVIANHISILALTLRLQNGVNFTQ